MILHIPHTDIYVGVAAKSAFRIKAADMLKEISHGHVSVLLSVEQLQGASKTDCLAPKKDLNKDYKIRISDGKD